MSLECSDTTFRDRRAICLQSDFLLKDTPHYR